MLIKLTIVGTSSCLLRTARREERNCFRWEATADWFITFVVTCGDSSRADPAKRAGKSGRSSTRRTRFSISLNVHESAAPLVLVSVPFPLALRFFAVSLAFSALLRFTWDAEVASSSSRVWPVLADESETRPGEGEKKVLRVIRQVRSSIPIEQKIQFRRGENMTWVWKQNDVLLRIATREAKGTELIQRRVSGEVWRGAAAGTAHSRAKVSPQPSDFDIMNIIT